MTTLRNRVKVRGGNNGSILGNRFCPSMMGPASSLLHKATEGNVSPCITLNRYLPTYLPDQPKIGSGPTVCEIFAQDFLLSPSKQIMTLFFFHRGNTALEPWTGVVSKNRTTRATYKSFVCQSFMLHSSDFVAALILSSMIRLHRYENICVSTMSPYGSV